MSQSSADAAKRNDEVKHLQDRLAVRKKAKCVGLRPLSNSTVFIRNTIRYVGGGRVVKKSFFGILEQI